MNNYAKGRKYEYEIINIFKQHGYKALRTAGSHSPFDIILWKQTEENNKICFVAFVQCKVSKLRPGKSAQPDSPEKLREQLSRLISKS